MLFTLKDRAELLPYFLRYYHKFGVNHFVCALHNGERNPLYAYVTAWKASVNISVHASHYSEPSGFSANLELQGIEAIRRDLHEEWIAVADMDEFYWLPGQLTFADLARILGDNGMIAATCKFVDRIARDGSLPCPGVELDETFPMACNLTQTLGACPDKVMLIHKSTPLSSGHHHIAGPGTTLRIGEAHHFKWQHGVLEAMKQRYLEYQAMGISYADECLKTVQRFVNGKLDFSTPGLEVWRARRIGV